MDLTLGFYFSIAVAGWLTFGSIHGRKAGAGTRPFAFFGLIIALWSVGELMVADAATPEARILARRIFFLGAAGLAPTWFWLSVRSAAPDWYMRRPQLIIAAFLAPGFFYSCLFWDRSVRFVDWTSLVPAHGPWFDIFTTYQYLLSMLGTYYFAKTAMRLGRSSVRVMSALIVGFGLPLVANLLYYFGQLGTDWTAVALGPAGILLWISVIESGLTSGLPIDRDDVIEQLEVGVIVADPADQIVSVNAAAERLAGMQGLRGRSLKEVLVAAEQRPDVVIESRRMALHGRFSVIGHALILSDRTDAERARRRLELGGRLEALGSLTAGIAHEVNNPLAFIQANLCSLDTTSKRLSSTEVCKNLPTELRESAKEMAALVEETQEGVERIRLLVNRLLNFSRMPDLRATAIEIDLESGVRKAAAVAEIGQTGQPISIVGTRGLRLVSIESAVFQILVNLLLNAVQAGSDEPKVTVEMAEKEAGVSVRIEDEGPGIPAVILSRIFDPFFTTKPMGTGLGLSLSYDLSVQLGGHLEASNREGGGAVFELWLPLSPPEPPTASSAHEDDPPARVA